MREVRERRTSDADAVCRETTVARVLVLCYSSDGHIETLASAVADGVRTAGARSDIKRVPELVPEEVAKGAQFKLDQAAPVALIDDLADYDAIIMGAPTRFGRDMDKFP
jgi:NAD(P)H dehydrogenase (quinone)